MQQDGNDLAALLATVLQFSKISFTYEFSTGYRQLTSRNTPVL